MLMSEIPFQVTDWSLVDATEHRGERGLALWPTRSKLVRFEPGRAVSWKTRESGATWTYELEPAGSGKSVVHAA